MNDLIHQITASMPCQVTITAVDMTWCGLGRELTVYSNGDAGNTVITRHKDSESVDTIVAAHMTARNPKIQQKARARAERVHAQVFGPDRLS